MKILNEKLKESMSASSWIRRMFDAGLELQKRVGVENVFDFSLGNPDLPPPPEAQAALADIAAHLGEARSLGYAGNLGMPPFREALAKKLAIEQEVPELSAANIVVSVGAAGAIVSFFRAVLEPGDEIIVPAPYFVEYGFYCGHFGGVLKPILSDTATWQPNIDAIFSAVTEKTRAILLNSPNNPTGAVYSVETMDAIAARVNALNENRERPIFIISDEPYRFLAYDGAVVPSVLSRSPWAIVIGSFSKSLSMPGERIGYIAVSPTMPDAELLVSALALTTRTLGFVNAPVLGQKLALAILGSGIDLSIYARRRKLMADVLSDAGIDFVEPRGAFYFFPRVPEKFGGDDVAFCNALMKENTLAVPGVGFGCRGHFRLSFSVEDNVITRAAAAFRKVALGVALAFAAFSAANAQVVLETTPEQEKALAEWNAAQPTGESFFNARGIAADKSKKRVEFLAQACGLAGSAIVEFPIVGELSDRCYEALFRAFAKPGDIVAALEFIGMKRGETVNPAALRFWSKGELVRATAVEVGGSNEVALCEMLWDLKEKAPANWPGFIFCGSRETTFEEKPCLLADAEAPNSIIATYNETQTVLDVPFRAGQNEVYQRFVINPARNPSTNTLWKIILTPVVSDLPRVREMSFTIAAGLTNLPTAFREIAEVGKAGQTPHVTVGFSDDVKVSEAIAAAKAFAKIDNDQMARIEPPSAGQIFYQGFLPNEEWRDAAKRTAQPLELHFFAAPDAAENVACIVKTLEDWSDPNSLDPVLTSVRTNLKKEQIAKIPAFVKEIGSPLGVILVFAPAEAPLGSFMPTVRELQATFPLVYVFAQ